MKSAHFSGGFGIGDQFFAETFELRKVVESK